MALKGLAKILMASRELTLLVQSTRATATGHRAGGGVGLHPADREGTRVLGAPDHHRGWSQAIGINYQIERIEFPSWGWGRFTRVKTGQEKLADAA